MGSCFPTQAELGWGTHHRALPVIVLIVVLMDALRMHDLGGRKSGARERRFLETPVRIICSS
jgi:hypothetical protein